MPAYPRRTRVYTRAHDRIVSAEAFFHELNSGTPFGHRFGADTEAMPGPDDVARIDRITVAVEAAFAPITPRPDLAVSLLLPQAGSLRGGKDSLYVGWVETATVLLAVLSRAGVAVEMIGYTTTSWKGGHSAEAWKAAGRPEDPGRLCDLLHVVYKAFDQDWTAETRHFLDLGTRAGFLRENVDGEAIDFAAERLIARSGAAERGMIVFDKRESVEDVTIQFNGPALLAADRAAAIDHARNAGITFAVIGEQREHAPQTMFTDAENRYTANRYSHDPVAAAIAVLGPWFSQDHGKP